MHHQLAWLAARCHRNVADGLKHAERATELDLKNATYLDTLGEVHFSATAGKMQSLFPKRLPRSIYNQITLPAS
jgi:hypothetical protein